VPVITLLASTGFLVPHIFPSRDLLIGSNQFGKWPRKPSTKADRSLRRLATPRRKRVMDLLSEQLPIPAQFPLRQ
jgi:hypothetical protein